MLIQVIFPNNRYDYVKDFMLDDLIESHEIAQFRRRNGWVTLGVDPIRQRAANGAYNGIERRAAFAALYPINIEVH
jgi:hypothetical protein